MSISVLGIGDNVVDKYLHSGIMYPGGNALNFAVYAKLADIPSAFMGAFGNDDAAQHVQDVLHQLQIDISHSRHYTGENGYACIRLSHGDRQFVASNKNGVLREHPFSLSDDDLRYISQFTLVHSSINGHLESELEKIKQQTVLLSFDFSGRGTDDYFEKVCPWVDYGFISCSGLSPDEIKIKLNKLYRYGCRHIIATCGHEKVYYFFRRGLSGVATCLYRTCRYAGRRRRLLNRFFAFHFAIGMAEPDKESVLRAMWQGGKSAAQILSHYGAFGFGKPFAQ